MSEFFNNILVSVSRLLFSSPAFVKIAEKSLSGGRQVQASSGEMGSRQPSSLDIFQQDSDARVNPPLFSDATASSRCAEPDLGPSRPTLGSRSATGGTSLGDCTRQTVSEPHYPLSDSDDDILALNSFSLSLVSDNSADDDGDFNVSGLSLDTLLSSSPPCSFTPFQSSPCAISGLGISGLTRKDRSGPFDGLGVVSIKSSAWSHDNLSSARKLGEGIDISESIQGFRRRPSSFSSCSSTCNGSSESEDFDPSLLITQGDRLSDVFLQETFLTFTEDPFHSLCHSNVVSSSSIRDGDNNDSWSELGLGDESISTSTSISEFKSLLVNTTTQSHDSRSELPPMMSSYRRRRIPKLNINFSSPTISSKLKRSSTIVGIPKNTWRYRSSSLPNDTMEDSATTPLSRCKWRL